MTSQYRHRRTSVASTVFPTLEPGEIAVNTANRQIAVGDAAGGTAGAPKALLALRYFDATAQYVLNDMVYQAGVVYRAKGAISPGAFNVTQWDMITGAIDPQYVETAGDTMTGRLDLPLGSVSAPTLSFGLGATTGFYATGTGSSSQVYWSVNGTYRLAVAQGAVTLNTPGRVVSSTAALPGWSFSTDSTSGFYLISAGNVGFSVGGTLRTTYTAADTISTVPVTLPADPTVALHAATKQYVDNRVVLAVRYDAAQTLTSAQASQARANINVTKKNYIINGGMMISQENGTTAGTVNGYYPVDCFYRSLGNTTGLTSGAQVASPTPSGSPNRLRTTVTIADAAVAAADFVYLITAVEGLRAVDLRCGTASAKAITIQFGCKAPAGTYCVALSNYNADRSYVAEYVIAAGEANTDVVKSVTLTLDTTGTWPADNTGQIWLYWILMSGSNYQSSAGAWTAGTKYSTTNQFNFMGTNGNVFELFDVSLTEGSVAPPFQLPDYATELVLCKRYYEKTYPSYDAPGKNYGSFNGGASLFEEVPVTTSFKAMRWFFQTSKRITPTVVSYSPNTGASGKFAVSGGSDVNSAPQQISELHAVLIVNNTAVNPTNIGCHMVANARM